FSCLLCRLSPHPPISTLSPYTTLFRSILQLQDGALAAYCLGDQKRARLGVIQRGGMELDELHVPDRRSRPVGHRHAITGRERRSDRKSTRLNSSHGSISYAVFCLKKKK